MEIVVQLNRKAAAELTEAPSGPARSRVVPELDSLGVDLEPMHRGERDPVLGSYFTAEVADEDAEQAVETLRKSDAVDAAYMKPAAEPP